MEFKDKVLYVRKKLRLTQSELAEQLNIDYVTINKWEKGIHSPQTLKENIFDTFCKEHGIEFDELMIIKKPKFLKEAIIELLNKYARSNETKARDIELGGHFISDNFERIFEQIAEARQSRDNKYTENDRWKRSGAYGGEKIFKQYQMELQIKDAIYYDKLERLYKYIIGVEKL